MGTALVNAVASGGRDCVLWSDDIDLVRERKQPQIRVISRDHVLSHRLSAITRIGEAVEGRTTAIHRVDTFLPSLFRNSPSNKTKHKVILADSQSLSRDRLDFRGRDRVINPHKTLC